MAEVALIGERAAGIATARARASARHAPRRARVQRRRPCAAFATPRARRGSRRASCSGRRHGRASAVDRAVLGVQQRARAQRLGRRCCNVGVPALRRGRAPNPAVEMRVYPTGQRHHTVLHADPDLVWRHLGIHFSSAGSARRCVSHRASSWLSLAASAFSAVAGCASLRVWRGSACVDDACARVAARACRAYVLAQEHSVSQPRCVRTSCRTSSAPPSVRARLFAGLSDAPR
ncbi:MAG: hypothetical protein JWP01_644 [Myxococcales bacterium]|nr:hypothetical protein [Myxococcales bacterium]